MSTVDLGMPRRAGDAGPRLPDRAVGAPSSFHVLAKPTRALHDAYRVDKGGKPTYDRVIRGLDTLKSHGVRWNVLTTVHRANEDHALEVYRFLRDDLGAEFIQIISIVERPSPGGIPTGRQVTDRSVTPGGYGRFLIEVFEDWVRRDVETVFVQMLDSTLASFVGVPGSLCVHSETCGTALALEHNGDLYSCDHFVKPDYLLGNTFHTHMLDLVASPRQKTFVDAKRDACPPTAAGVTCGSPATAAAPRTASPPPPTAKTACTTSAPPTKPSSATSTHPCGTWPPRSAPAPRPTPSWTGTTDTTPGGTRRLPTPPTT